MKAQALRLHTVLPVAAAASLGILLAVTSHNLHWGETTTFLVGCGAAAFLGFFGVPIFLGVKISRVNLRRTRTSGELKELGFTWRGILLPAVEVVLTILVLSALIYFI